MAERYLAVVLDLDGVVYRGDRVLPGAPDALAAVREAGCRLLFLTNNSSRTAGEVAATLSAMGVSADPSEVLTSGQATAAMLGRERRAGATAFVIGERGVREPLAEAGITLVDGEPERADLVVVGWDRSVDYPKLRTAALLVQRGARLVATNADASYPAPDGLWPGAGAILAAVTTATGAVPTVVGKPGRALFEAAAEALGVAAPLMVGDRLETDVRGAAAAGWDSLLVRTGAAEERDLLSAPALPTYVGGDLSALLAPATPGRFRSARDGDLDSVRALLESAGLSAVTAGERIATTVVCPSDDAPGALAATAAVQDVAGHGILRSVAVAPALRGRGLGLLATAHAVRLARERGIARFALFTETAPGFFERLGFERVGREDLPAAVRDSEQAADETCASAVPMVLEL